jgi:hypothetical protein
MDARCDAPKITVMALAAGGRLRPPTSPRMRVLVRGRMRQRTRLRALQLELADCVARGRRAVPGDDRATKAGVADRTVAVGTDLRTRRSGLEAAS